MPRLESPDILLAYRGHGRGAAGLKSAGSESHPANAGDTLQDLPLVQAVFGFGCTAR